MPLPGPPHERIRSRRSHRRAGRRVGDRRGDCVLRRSHNHDASGDPQVLPLERRTLTRAPPAPRRGNAKARPAAGRGGAAPRGKDAGAQGADCRDARKELTGELFAAGLIGQEPEGGWLVEVSSAGEVVDIVHGTVPGAGEAWRGELLVCGAPLPGVLPRGRSDAVWLGGSLSRVREFEQSRRRFASKTLDDCKPLHLEGASRVAHSGSPPGRPGVPATANQDHAPRPGGCAHERLCGSRVIVPSGL